MATIYSGSERVEVPDDDLRIVAYNALYHAAERIGKLNGSTQLRRHLRAGRVRHTFRFVVTEAHREVVDAMSKVLSGEITPEQAMGLLWTYEVAKERGVKP